MNSVHASSQRGAEPMHCTGSEPPVIELLRGFPTRLVRTGDTDAGALEVDEAQRQVFLCVLEAMTQPGRIVRVPRSGVDRPPPDTLLGTSAVTLLRTLLENEGDLWMGPSVDCGALRTWLLRHTAARLAQGSHDATFVVTHAADAHPGLWHSLAGNDERELSFAGPTLMIEVPRLLADPPPPRREPGDVELMPRLRLSVPGLARSTRLGVDGLGRHFWRARMALQAQLRPCPVELILVCGDHIAAIPRAARVALDD